MIALLSNTIAYLSVQSDYRSTKKDHKISLATWSFALSLCVNGYIHIGRSSTDRKWVEFGPLWYLLLTLSDLRDLAIEVSIKKSTEHDHLSPAAGVERICLIDISGAHLLRIRGLHGKRYYLRSHEDQPWM